MILSYLILSFNLICEVLQKDQVRSVVLATSVCVCDQMYEMKVNEARGVCNDRSRWHSVVFAYPHGEKVVSFYLF